MAKTTTGSTSTAVSTQHPTPCRNCGTPDRGEKRFCAQCGQKNTLVRLQLRTVISDAVDHLFDLEQPMIYTLRNLAYRPGWIAMEYIDGRRKEISNPIKLCVVLIAVFLLALQITGIDFAQSMTTFVQSQPTQADGIAQILTDIGIKAEAIKSQYRVLFTFCSLPLLAIAMRILFWKSRFNTTEYFAAGALVMAFVTAIQILTIPIALVTHPLVAESGDNILLIYWPITVWQMIPGNRILVVLKSILGMLFFFIASGLILYALAALGWWWQSVGWIVI